MITLAFSISAEVSRDLISTILTGRRLGIRFTGVVSSQPLVRKSLIKIDIYAGGYGGEFGLDSQAVLDIHSRDSLEKRTSGKFKPEYPLF